MDIKRVEQILSSEGVVLQVKGAQHPLSDRGEFKIILRHLDDMMAAVNLFYENRRGWEYLPQQRRKEILHTLWWVYDDEPCEIKQAHSFDSCCTIVGVDSTLMKQGIQTKLNLSKQELIQYLYKEGDPNVWLHDV